LAATVTDAGTVATAVLLLLSAATTPPAGAAPVRVTVPVLVLMPATEVGFREREESAGGLTVTEAVLLTPLNVAVIVTVAAVVTVLLAMVNVALLAFAATVTDAGTVAAALLLLVRVTTAPPAGAGPVSVTVPALFAPPVTEVGLAVMAESAVGLTVSVAVLLTPL
jgi:hypothetical protein